VKGRQDDGLLSGPGKSLKAGLLGDPGGLQGGGQVSGDAVGDEFDRGGEPIRSGELTQGAVIVQLARPVVVVADHEQIGRPEAGRGLENRFQVRRRGVEMRTQALNGEEPG